MSLSKQTFSGVIWTSAQQFGSKIISFLLIQIVLARLLEPSDFAPIALLTVFIALSSVLTDGGLSSSLIKTQDTDDRDFSTVFWINFLGSVIIYFILFFTSPLLALYFELPILENVVKLYCIVIIISSLSNVQNVRLTKMMDFKTQTMITVPSLIVSSLLGIVCAWYGMAVYSIVVLSIAQASITTIFLWYKTKWRPQFIFDKEKFRKHFNYSYKITFSGILNAFFSNIYTLIIGKQFNATTIGLYNKADGFRVFPVQSIAQALNKVTFPMFSKIQDDDKKLKQVYRKIMKVVIYIFAPIYVCLFLVGEPLFYIVLGEKWIPAVPYFQLLCFASILYPLHSYNLNILMVKGRTDLFLYLEIAKKILTAVGIMIAIPYGIYGLIYFQIIFSVLAFVINSFYSGRMIDYSTWRQILDIGLYFIIAIGAGIIVYYANTFLNINNHYFAFIFSSIVFLALYSILCNIFRISHFQELRKLILKK